MNLSRMKNKISKFPDSPGVYIFIDFSGKILYIGKATSLKERVRQYFSGTDERGTRIFKMVEKIADIKIQKTESVLEALILESNLIKKHQPKYNIERKDDKSFSYIVITKEDFPRILILRKTELEKNKKLLNKSYQLKAIYGPYTSKKQLEIALKIMRKIFPYHSRSEKSEKGCLDFQIGLCSGPYAGAISKNDYKKNILGIRMILEGKKKTLVSKLKKEMGVYSQKKEFEKAAEVRNKIFALQHIQDIALVSDFGKDKSQKGKKIRIEGYDISNISGKFSVGSMVVFDNLEGELKANKKEYRKFKIKTFEDANDVGMMKEVLERRFGNNWSEPDLILLDGGVGHLNTAKKILKNYKLEIPILAVAKGPTRKKLDLRAFGAVPKISEDIIQKVRDEAHRFAISYHRKLRDKNLIKID